MNMVFPEDIKIKYDRLENIIKGLGKLVVACSGGLDGMLMAIIASKVLGPGNVTAVTVDSPNIALCRQGRSREINAGFRCKACKFNN